MKSSKVNYGNQNRGYGRQNVMPMAAQQKMDWSADGQNFMMGEAAADFGVMHEEMTAAIVEDKFVAATFQLSRDLFVPSNNRVPSKVISKMSPIVNLTMSNRLGINCEYPTQVECATLRGAKTFQPRVLTRLYS